MNAKGTAFWKERYPGREKLIKHPPRTDCPICNGSGNFYYYAKILRGSSSDLSCLCMCMPEDLPARALAIFGVEACVRFEQQDRMLAAAGLVPGGDA